MARQNDKTATHDGREVNQSETRGVRFRNLVVLVLAGLFVAWFLLWDYGYREWQLNRAKHELAQLEISRARNRLSELVVKYPEHPDVRFWLGRAERRDGMPADAMADFEEARKLDADETQIQIQVRLMDAQAGRVVDTESFVKEFSSLDDDLISEEVYEALAQGFMFTGRYRDALACLSYWIEWRSQHVRPRLYRAEVLIRVDKWEKAIEEYETILEFAPESEEARRAYARTLLNYRDAHESLEEYRKLLNQHPEDPELLLGLSKSLEKLGEHDLAQQNYQLLMTMELNDETRLETCLGLGKSLLFAQQPQGAREFLMQALDIDPFNREVHMQLAAVYAELHEQDKAVVHRERAEELNQAQVRLKELIELLTKSPQEADLRYEAGSLLEQLGQQDQAIAWWNAATVIAPNHAPTHRRLEKHYRQQGDESRAEMHRQLADRAE